MQVRGLILIVKSLWLETGASCESKQGRGVGRGLGKKISNRTSGRVRIRISPSL